MSPNVAATCSTSAATPVGFDDIRRERSDPLAIGARLLGGLERGERGFVDIGDDADPGLTEALRVSETTGPDVIER